MKRYYKSEEINTKNHFLVNTIWPVAGSKKGDEYRIEMHDKGFTCECKGFMYNSKCRHTKASSSIKFCVYEDFTEQTVHIVKTCKPISCGASVWIEDRCIAMNCREIK